MKQRSSIQNIMRLKKHLVQVLKNLKAKNAKKFYSKFSETKNVWFTRKKFVQKQNEIVFD
jgi:uncharacterized protein YpbB